MFTEMSNENRNPFEFLFSQNLMKKSLLPFKKCWVVVFFLWFFWVFGFWGRDGSRTHKPLLHGYSLANCWLTIRRTLPRTCIVLESAYLFKCFGLFEPIIMKCFFMSATLSSRMSCLVMRECMPKSASIFATLNCKGGK